MLDQYFKSHCDQDQTTGQLCFRFKAGSKEIADPDTNAGTDKGNDPDKTDGGNNMNLKEGKGDTHSQGVNAGSYG